MISKMNFVMLVAFACYSPLAQAEASDGNSREYLESLDDVSLLLHGDARAALDVYRERSAHYTEKENAAVFAAVREARRALQSRDGASVDVLLDRINTSDSSSQRIDAMMALRKHYVKSDEVEQKQVRALFLNAWRALLVPQEDPLRQGINRRVGSYLHMLPEFFPEEADALPILEEMCIDSKLSDGTLMMYRTLSTGKFELGPLSTAKAEALYRTVFQSGKMSTMDGETYFALQACLLKVMGRSGESGMEALRRLDVLATPDGLIALRAMRTPEAEEMLWEMVEDPKAHPLTKMDAIDALYRYHKNYLGEERLHRLRAPLSEILKTPEPDAPYHLNIMERAVALAGQTHDPYYKAHVVALESGLDSQKLASTDLANQEGMDLERFPNRYTSDSLRETIVATKQKLRN